ncbi:hypothetical protein RhiirA4_522351, partial [Rhizophagus irregularis]
MILVFLVILVILVNQVIDNDSEESPRLFKKLKTENVDVQNDYEREIMQQQSNIGNNDEVQNNPNLHSEEKDKQEILDGCLKLIIHQSADITSRDGKNSKWSDSSDQVGFRVERWNHFQAEMSSSSETSGSMRVGL